MFINENIIAFAFRFINLISLIGLGFYIFKKQFASSIWDTIAKNSNDKQNLYNQQLALEKKQQELDTLLKEESIRCEQFRQKIDTWKNIVTLDTIAREKKYHEHKALITTKKNNIALHKEHDRVQTIVLNRLIPELQKSLTDHFNNEQNGADYLNSIVHFMNERI